MYDGAGAPYSERDEAHPVNVYGATKLAFEQQMQQRLPTRSVALRMSLLLGPPAPRRSSKQNSFLQDCDRMLGSGRPHDFFSDEFRSVVAVDDVLAVLLWAVDGGACAAPGVYNMGGPQRVSRVDVALAVAAHRGHPTDGVHGRPRPAPAPGAVRSPPDIAMDSRKLERAVGRSFRPLVQMLPSAFQ